MNAVNQVLNGIDKVFGVIEKYITAFALIVFTVVIFCNVVGRYVLLNSIPWAEELSRYLNIFLVYIALSAGIKTDAHIGVDAVETLLVPKRFHKYMDVVRFAITTVFCLITAWLGWELALQIGQMKQTSPSMQIPMMVPYLALPIGLFMASIRSLMRIIQMLMGPAEEHVEEKQEELDT